MFNPKILIIADNLRNEKKGGAERSLLNIVKGLKKRNIEFKIITNINLPFSELTIYIYFFKILKIIKKFKPDIIITQRTISSPAILCSLITKIPIIAMIRDLTSFCPKKMNIIAYGISCEEEINRKICFECINRWRTLRVLIGNKRKEYINSISMIIHNIFYKFRYFICKLNYILLNKSSLNIVASRLMVNKLQKLNNVETSKIVPFRSIINDFKDQEKSNYLLFVSPSYDSSGKGKDFILRISKKLPSNLKILNVGNEINENLMNKNIVDAGFVSKDELDFIYSKCKITLFPSFHTESFGRVILESIFNNTPVICSNNCGALEYVKDNSYVYEVPIKLNSWVLAIKKIINKDFEMEDNFHLFDEFSIDSCVNNILLKIKEVLKNEKRK